MDELVLIKPSKAYLDEIYEYRQEFLDNDERSAGDSGLRHFEDISAWLERCRLTESKETIPDPALVESEQFMLLYKGEKRILGMINFRHYMNDYVAEYAGHIGYGVRPTERRKGYAKKMLGLCLEKCRLFSGLDKVLITCDDDNEASRRTILAAKGVFERTNLTEDGQVGERYWITLV